MKTGIMQQVKNILAEILKLDPGEIHEDTQLKEELGLDSMSSLTFLMELEDRIKNFVVDPDTLEADHLLSVKSIVHYIESQMKKTAA